jgi:2-oxoisovalerate dehydrogenase E1 component
MPAKSAAKKVVSTVPRAAAGHATPRPGFDWRRIAYHTLASRSVDEVEESHEQLEV